MSLRRLLLGCWLVAALALAGPAGSTNIAVPHFSIDPIGAEFHPGEFATHYFILDTTRFHTARKVTDTWTFQLRLVDPLSAAAPGVPNSGAGVDVGCVNHGHGVHNRPYVDVMEYDPKDGDYGTTHDFVFHHGDQDGCDHTLMGPHGHQVLIKVIVSDGSWECTETYKGTNSSTPGESVKNGTASEPKCAVER